MVNHLRRIIFLFAVVLVEEICCGRSCLSGDLSSTQCPQNQTCVPADLKSDEAYCNCSPGYVKITDDLCLYQVSVVNARIPTTAVQDFNSIKMISSSRDLSQSSGVSVVISLVSCLFIIFLICIVYFNYRHRFVSRLWIKINQRRRNYDEVLIGEPVDDDDPPLV